MGNVASCLDQSNVIFDITSKQLLNNTEADISKHLTDIESVARCVEQAEESTIDK